jgi:hypothetical protein
VNEIVRRILLVLTVALVIAAMMAAAAPVAFAAPAGTGLVGPCEQEFHTRGSQNALCRLIVPTLPGASGTHGAGPHH